MDSSTHLLPRRGPLRFLLTIGLLLVAARFLAAQPAPDDGVITKLHEFWNVPQEKRNQLHRVRFEIDVDYYDHEWRTLWARAQGAGWYFNSGPDKLPIEPGKRYLVEGRMSPTDGLTLAGAIVTPLPDAAPVDPLPATGHLHEFQRFQNQVVTIEGYVQRQSLTDARHLLIEVQSDDVIFSGRVLVQPGEIVPDFLDSKVRLTGVYVARPNQFGQLSQLEMWITGTSKIELIGRLLDDRRFNVPAVSIEDIPRLPPDTPVLIRGTVHSAEPGKAINVRDKTGQARVFTAQTRPVRFGDYIEAVGIPAIRGAEWSLNDAFFRVIQSAGNETAGDSHLSILRLAEQVLELRPEDAARGTPAKLTGVITWVRGSSSFIYIQDASGGVRVELPESFRPSRDMAYTLVEITGTTAVGTFAPVVRANQVTQLGQTSFPVPRAITLEQAMTGVEDSQWVEMRGYLHEVTHDDLWTKLSITSSAGEFSVHVVKQPNLASLVGAMVRVTGVCVVNANERRELTGITLLVPNADSIQVEEPAPADPFSIPQRTIASLRQYSPLQALNRRVRIAGQVVHHVPGRFLYIQDGESGLFALSRGTEALRPGEHVEIAGFPGRESNRLLLRQAVFRKVGDATPLAPAELRYADRPSEALDGRLVRLSGRVLESSRREAESVLLIQSERGVFEARLDGARTDLPSVGDQLRVTGVYQVEFDEYRQPRGFYLRLRSAHDVELLARASWWTITRALTVASLLSACVLLGFAWVTVLRRRVKKQTAQLRDQLEKEALMEARHREIIENASDFIFTLDPDGRLTSFNPAGERMTGLAHDEAIGRHLNDLVAPEDTAHPLPLFTLASASDPAITFQTRFRTAGGDVIWVEICARLLSHAGKSQSILAVARDISDRKEIEEELRRARDAAEANTRAKSAFLANMSHEIRTPMNGVIGMSNLLLDTRLSDEQRDFAETIRNSAESLLTVLNDILDFSKIEAGKLQFETIDFDLHETVESTLELLAARASGKGLELASYLPPELPRWIRGDPGRLRQILLNLIGNAIKFTDKGEVVVAVALERETDDEIRLHFEVTDTGPGLDAETQARLFQPFSQADGSTTRRFGGTGLGLAISKQIVQLMDGQIGVRSTPGHGATFWFTVRLDKQPFGTSHEQPPRVTALNGLRALIVDDNATNRKILQHYCIAWGVRGESVTNGPAALDALRAGVASGDPFQLVLTDYQMPEMDGLMLAREIQQDPKISGARVVLLTSWDRRFSREELTTCGVIRMLVKPIRQHDLLGALLRCVRIGFGTNSSGSNLPSRSSPPADDPAPRIPPSSRALRVLIAEDNIVNQRVASLQLKNLGHTVEIAANGLEVLKALETSSYDVIFMDGQMPELDGYETTRRIRRNPSIAAIHIIAMTANAMQGDRERCLEAGMDDYISKPTRPEDLQAALARCISRQSSALPFVAASGTPFSE